VGLIEFNPNTYAAPRTRPNGMDRTVPYEPMMGKRNTVFDFIQHTAVKGFYDSGLYKVPHALFDRFRRDQLAPVQGTPGGPVADVPGGYKVAVIGDMGEGSPAQDRNTEWIRRWNPTHVATVGDNVYPLGREKDWARRFDPAYAELRTHTTWMPALGNHDYYSGDLTPYFARFSHLQGQAYYTWTLGPAQFFVLDSEQRLDGSSAQQAWLAAELAKSTAPYKVVQLHRPLVASRGGSIADRQFGDLGPLLARYGVDLVLAGHVHGYERSLDKYGITHVVTGGGGAATYGYVGAPPKASIVRSGRNHHLQLSFDDSRMVVRAVDDRGVAFDSTVLTPSPAAPAAPRRFRSGAPARAGA